MATSVKYRNPRTNEEVEQSDPKLQKIMEDGGYVKVTANTPKVPTPPAEPSTVAEHVQAAKEAGKTAKPAESITRADAPDKSA